MAHKNNTKLASKGQSLNLIAENPNLRSECSETCGSSSSRTRDRFCKDGRFGGALCSSPVEKQVETCHLQPCPGLVILIS